MWVTLLFYVTLVPTQILAQNNGFYARKYVLEYGDVKGHDNVQLHCFFFKYDLICFKIVLLTGEIHTYLYRITSVSFIDRSRWFRLDLPPPVISFRERPGYKGQTRMKIYPV